MNFIYKRLIKLASLHLIFPALLKAFQIARSGDGRKKLVTALTQHLGDNIAAESLDTHIKDLYPDQFNIRIVGKSFSTVVSNNPNIDLLISVSCLSEWVYLKKIVSRFYKVYDYHVDKSFCLKYRLKISNPNPFGIDDSNYYNHGNLLEIFCKCSGVEVINIRPVFRLDAGYSVKNIPENIAVIHVTSNSEQREWTRDKWLQLIEFFAGKGMTVIEVGLVSNLNCTHPSYINYCGKLSLLQIAGVISECRYFVGIDSAFAHFANAFNVPRLILLGHFNQFTYYLPYSGMSKEEEMQTVIHFDGQVRDIPFETVKSKIMID